MVFTEAECLGSESTDLNSGVVLVCGMQRVLYRRGSFVEIFRSEECDASRTRERPEDPSETWEEHQALENPHQNPTCRGC
jgi:hypothetical protein